MADKMRAHILIRLRQIKKAAMLTGMKGEVCIEFTGFTVAEWDNIIASINEYPRRKHFVQVTPELTVSLLLG
jgi:hypothetical protein